MLVASDRSLLSGIAASLAGVGVHSLDERKNVLMNGSTFLHNITWCALAVSFDDYEKQLYFYFKPLQ